jgi:hypothetical protein
MRKHSELKLFYRVLLVIIPVCGLILISYSRRPFNQNKNNEYSADSQIIPPIFNVPEGKIGCKALMDQYCTKLYSTEARGNLRVTDGAMEFLTLQGQTQNNFDTAGYSFYQVRLEKKAKLPYDLRKSLVKRKYFELLAKMLKRPNKKNLEFEQGIAQKELEKEVDRIWNNAIDEVIASRLEIKFPGSYQLSEEELPQEVDFERTRVRFRLWSEISVALWTDHPRWLKVQQVFDRLKDSFRVAIKSNVKSEEIQKAWLTKLAKMKLKLPGQNPMTANQECISTARNAYYYPYLNTLTVCAGYFNGGEQIQTLAHEMAHGFDYNSRLVDYMQSSILSQSIKTLRKDLCETPEFDCETWNNFRQNFSSQVASITSYQAEFIPFHQCLQKTKPTKEITPEIIEEKSTKLTKMRFSDFTKNSSLFRITSESLPTEAGGFIKNPNYLNPCGYYIWNTDLLPLDSEFTSLLFFTSAYRCDTKDKENPVRAAVEISREMTKELIKAAISSESEFSSRAEMQTDSYSSPPTERFADRLGSFVVAEYLRKYPTAVERRTRYLVSSSWLCDRPSLRSSNYHMYQALRDLIVDRTLYPESADRMKDWLSPNIREQLSCQTDFKHDECIITE